MEARMLIGAWSDDDQVTVLEFGPDGRGNVRETKTESPATVFDWEFEPGRGLWISWYQSANKRRTGPYAFTLSQTDVSSRDMISFSGAILPFGRSQFQRLDPSRDSDQERPRFQIGARVRVVVNEHNRTPHEGAVERGVWHFKDSRWYYFLRERGAKVSKRYAAEDLTPASDDVDDQTRR
jgi:hypothetical protein